MKIVIDHLANCLNTVELQIEDSIKQLERLELRLDDERNTLAELREYKRATFAAIRVLEEAEGQ